MQTIISDWHNPLIRTHENRIASLATMIYVIREYVNYQQLKSNCIIVCRSAHPTPPSTRLRDARPSHVTLTTRSRVSHRHARSRRACPTPRQTSPPQPSNPPLQKGERRSKIVDLPTTAAQSQVAPPPSSGIWEVVLVRGALVHP